MFGAGEGGVFEAINGEEEAISIGVVDDFVEQDVPGLMSGGFSHAIDDPKRRRCAIPAGLC